MAVVLVVDDEVRIRELVRRYLEHEGHQVLTAGSGAEALESARRTAVDLIVLDLRLPDITGEEVAAEIRRTSDVPILMLTAKVDERDRIYGLEVGADDYVTKPFSPRELVLRIGAILRRGRSSTAEEPTKSFGDGALIIDEATRRVTAHGVLVELTPTEWGVLLALAAQPGRVFERFYRGDSTRSIAGSGIGLAVVAQLVKAHGGSVELIGTSTGTTIVANFPSA